MIKALKGGFYMVHSSMITIRWLCTALYALRIFISFTGPAIRTGVTWGYQYVHIKYEASFVCGTWLLYLLLYAYWYLFSLALRIFIKHMKNKFLCRPMSVLLG